MSRARKQLVPAPLHICSPDPHIPMLASALRESVDYEYNRLAAYIGAGDVRGAQSSARTLAIYGRRVLWLDEAVIDGASLLDLIQGLEGEMRSRERGF